MNDDRIWEMYHSDAYQPATRRACRARIGWLVDRASGRVLDIGCSQGLVPILLGRKGVHAVGIDNEAPAIGFARARLADEPAEVQERVSFELVDASTWRPPEPFDTVILGEVLEHLDRPADLLAAARRALAEGGQLLVTVPLGWLEHPDHRQAFLPTRLIELIEAGDFSVQACDLADGKIRLAARAGAPTDAAAVEPSRLLRDVEQALLALQYTSLDSLREVERRHAEQIDRLERRLRARERELAKVRSERDKMAAQADRLLAKVEDLRQKAERLSADKKKLRSSASYQLGWLLVRAGMHPASVLRLPDRLMTLAVKETLGLGRKQDAASLPPRPHKKRSDGQTRADENQRVYQGRYRVSLSDARPAGAPVEGRILHLLEYSLPHKQNGYTLRSAQVLQAQKQHGFDPVVVTRPGFPEGAAPSREPEMVAGVPHYRLPGDGLPDKPTLPGYIHTYAAEAAEIVTQARPEIVQAGSSFRNAYAGLELSRHFNVPFVYEVRGLWEETRVANGSLDPEEPKYRHLRSVETYCMRQADAVVTLSESLKGELVRRGVSGDKIFLVPNAVALADEARRPPRADLRRALGLGDRFVVSYIGSVTRLESLDTILYAMQILRRQRRDIAALIVGDGGDRTRLEELAAQKGLEDTVVFTGRVPHQDIPDYYAITDVVACTRGRDRVCQLVTPLKPYEAMAYRKPVIVTDVPALCEMVEDGVTGCVVPVAQPAELARAIAELADHPERAAQLGDQARAWVAQHRTWHRVAEGYGPAYEFARAAFARRKNGSSPPAAPGVARTA